MRQNKVFDVRFPGNLPNHRRRHVQISFHSGDAFRDCVVSNEQIRIRRQLWQTRALAIRIAAENDDFAAHLYSPRKGWNSSVDHAHRLRGNAATAKHFGRLRASHNVVRLQFVAAFLSRHKQLAQIAKSAVFISKKIGNKLRRGRHEVISLRPVDWQWALAIFKPRRLDQHRKISAVIDVEVREQNHIKLRHLRPAFAESKRASSASIHKHSRSPVFPEEIAARSPLVLQFWPAGPKHLQSDPLRSAGLCSRWRQEGETQHKAKGREPANYSEKSWHEMTPQNGQSRTGSLLF